MAKQAMAKGLDAALVKEITNCVIDRLRDEEKKAVKTQMDKRRASTRLLLQNYRILVDHFESAVFTVSQVDVDDGLSLGEVIELINGNSSDWLKVESIRQSSVKTKIIVTHINTMLEFYRTFCERSPKEEDKRRYRVIYWLYLDSDPKTVEELADEEKTNERTIYRDVSAAIEQLTALFFGIDGIKKLVE